jgi:hypothetical protein
MLPVTLDCICLFPLCALGPMLPVTLDCILFVSVVCPGPNVTCDSGLSILDCRFGFFLTFYLSMVSTGEDFSKL